MSVKNNLTQVNYEKEQIFNKIKIIHLQSPLHCLRKLSGYI
jgi:hypothetical protein